MSENSNSCEVMRQSFAKDLAEVCWRDLRIHTQRDAIILLAGSVDLIDAALAVAQDDKAAVENWLAAGQLGKPDQTQLQQWEEQLDKPFRMLIVQPFILAQAVEHG